MTSMVSAAEWIPLFSAIALFMARLAELKKRRDVIPGVVRETATLRLFLLAGGGMLIASMIEYWLRSRPYLWGLYAAGVLVGAFSFVIRRRAIAALGQFWSLHIEIRENHQFVQSGPFRWVRHPTYFSMILELISGALILNAPYSLAAVSLLFVPALWWRVRLEESAMVGKFGEAYAAYQRSTPAIIPYKWPAAV